jgi:hypothetical protein
MWIFKLKNSETNGSDFGPVQEPSYASDTILKLLSIISFFNAKRSISVADQVS